MKRLITIIQSHIAIYSNTMRNTALTYTVSPLVDNESFTTNKFVSL